MTLRIGADVGGTFTDVVVERDGAFLSTKVLTTHGGPEETATAFRSGVMTMSAEATEPVGPIVIWRKEIREGSGGEGRQRGGLGQIIEIGAIDGYQLELSAMLDRVDNPARGRDGGGLGDPAESDPAAEELDRRQGHL